MRSKALTSERPKVPTIPSTTQQPNPISSSSTTTTYRPTMFVPSPPPTTQKPSIPTTKKINATPTTSTQPLQKTPHRSHLENNTSTSSTRKPYFTYNDEKRVWVPSMSSNTSSNSQTRGGASKTGVVPEIKEQGTSMKKNFNVSSVFDRNTSIPLSQSSRTLNIFTEATTTESPRMQGLVNDSVQINDAFRLQNERPDRAYEYNPTTAVNATEHKETVTQPRFAKTVQFTATTVQPVTQKPYTEPRKSNVTAPPFNSLLRRPQDVKQEPYSKFPLSDVRNAFVQIPLSYKCNNVSTTQTNTHACNIFSQFLN